MMGQIIGKVSCHKTSETIYSHGADSTKRMSQEGTRRKVVENKQKEIDAHAMSVEMEWKSSEQEGHLYCL